MAVNQQDHMSAITDGDRTAFKACKSMLPCGTMFSHEGDGPFMRGGIDKARAMLKDAGYKGKKVVVISPGDFPTIGPLGELIHDVFPWLGMNVESVSTDMWNVRRT